MRIKELLLVLGPHHGPVALTNGQEGAAHTTDSKSAPLGLRDFLPQGSMDLALATVGLAGGL